MSSRTPRAQIPLLVRGVIRSKKSFLPASASTPPECSCPLAVLSSPPFVLQVPGWLLQCVPSPLEPWLQREIQKEVDLNSRGQRERSSSCSPPESTTRHL
ncbi:hypothetical protein RvY_07893 [Ramazzottius varieornatus]|uniref:Uncharacterized protein n=1 Tax=Ramazzottius varieornatus TaxID=947166 RepID=A0A1D1VD68_RAMVA|nr:hypothetical protein RvY_07893 [Ramazzottius varieornatus]